MKGGVGGGSSCTQGRGMGTGEGEAGKSDERWKEKVLTEGETGKVTGKDRRRWAGKVLYVVRKEDACNG